MKRFNFGENSKECILWFFKVGQKKIKQNLVVFSSVWKTILSGYEFGNRLTPTIDHNSDYLWQQNEGISLGRFCCECCTNLENVWKM